MSKGNRKWATVLTLIDAHERDWEKAWQEDEVTFDEKTFAIRGLRLLALDIRRMSQGQAPTVWQSDS